MLQADFLQKTLAEKKAELRDKALFGLIQKGFGMVPFDILVAISDTGIIHRKADVPEVLKADQVVDHIREIMGRRCVSFASFAVKSKNENDPWVSTSREIYAMTYGQMVGVGEAMGWTKTDSWQQRNGYSTRHPSPKLLALLLPYRMDQPQKWRDLMALFRATA